MVFIKKIILVCTLVLVLLFVGCEKKVECNKPYILVGSECCLDKDDNGICDKDEFKEEIKVEEKTVTKPDCRISGLQTFVEICKRGDITEIWKGHIDVSNWGQDGFCVLKIKYGDKDTVFYRQFLVNDGSYTYEWGNIPEDMCDFSQGTSITYLLDRGSFVKGISKEIIGKTLTLGVSEG